MSVCLCLHPRFDLKYYTAILNMIPLYKYFLSAKMSERFYKPKIGIHFSCGKEIVKNNKQRPTAMSRHRQVVHYGSWRTVLDA